MKSLVFGVLVIVIILGVDKNCKLIYNTVRCIIAIVLIAVDTI